MRYTLSRRNVPRCADIDVDTGTKLVMMLVVMTTGGEQYHDSDLKTLTMQGFVSPTSGSTTCETRNKWFATRQP